MRLLVIKKDDSFRVVALATNQSVDLWNQRATYINFIFRILGNEAYFVMRGSTGRYIAKRMPGELQLLHFNLTQRDCWHQFKYVKGMCANETTPLVYFFQEWHTIKLQLNYWTLGWTLSRKTFIYPQNAGKSTFAILIL